MNESYSLAKVIVSGFIFTSHFIGLVLTFMLYMNMAEIVNIINSNVATPNGDFVTFLQGYLVVVTFFSFFSMINNLKKLKSN
jgi:hypothetical protein